MIKMISELREKIKQNQPLIHCITNHISINACANAVLALGAKPIMAEHPKECGQITLSAQALAVNLGNISDTRMDAIMISGKTAYENRLPIVIDIVGTACSDLRKNFALEFIKTAKPTVIKGNESEIRALCGLKCRTKGIDSCENNTIDELIECTENTAVKFNAVVMISGRTDVISNGENTVLVKNGSEYMPYVTGTGCMQNVVCGTFLSVCGAFEGAVCAAVTMGIAGEYAEEVFKRTGSITAFKNSLIDGLFNVDAQMYKERAKMIVGKF